MEDPTPFFVGGGASHSPEVVRQSIYDSTGGAEGVSSVGALKVSALAQAGTRVRVAPGGGLMRNRYPGGSGQSYSGRNATETEVDITATGSGGGRTDMVVLRVLDPQYEGQPPLDPKTFKYTRLAVVQGVPANARTAAELNLNYPAIALARIAMPVSTATVQESYLTDLRKLAQPRQEIHNRLLFPANNKTMSKTGYDSWPFSGTMSNIEVPDWATNLDIVATVNGIEIAGTNASTVLQTGGVRTGFAGDFAPNGIVRGYTGRQSISIIGRHVVTQAMRDAGVGPMYLQGYQTGGDGYIEADYQSGIAVQWTWTEVPS